MAKGAGKVMDPPSETTVSFEEIVAVLGERLTRPIC
jgi:hypothetical protein